MRARAASGDELATAICHDLHMPVYDFLCRSCDHRFDDLVSLAAVDGQRCPECTSGEVVKLYSPFKVGASSRTSGMDATGGACLPGPARAGGCCGGGCGGCG